MGRGALRWQKNHRPLSALCDDLKTQVLETTRVVRSGRFKDAAEGRNILCEVNSMVLSYIRGLDPAHCTEQEVQHHYLECEQEEVETEEDMEHMVNVVTTCVEELIKSGELVVVTESPHSDEPELRILAPRAAAARGWGAFTCPESLLAPAAARRSAAAPSSVGQPAESALPVPSDAVFTTFDTLESVKEWLSSLPLDEQNTVQALQRLRAAVEACTAGSGKRAKVQKMCQDWGISQKVNQQKRTLPDVLAEMTAKVLENASKLARVARSQAPALTAKRSPASVSNVEQPAADFTTFDTLEAVKRYLRSLPLHEQKKVKALQHLKTTMKVCKSSSGSRAMQAKVQKLCKDWSIQPKANQSNQQWADVMADMNKPKCSRMLQHIFENAQQESST